MTDRRVVITGLGCVTPLAENVELLFEWALSGSQRDLDD